MYVCKGVARILEKGGANLLVYDYITRAKNIIPRNPPIYYNREACFREGSFETGPAVDLAPTRAKRAR